MTEFTDTPGVDWYKTYWHPWGHVTGWHYEAFIDTKVGVVSVNRHVETKTDKLQFYCPNGYTAGKGEILRFKTWKKCMAFLNSLTPTSPQPTR